MSIPTRLAEHYAFALKAHLRGSGEAALSRAYELGREALGSGLGVLDMATLYQRALESELLQDPDAQQGLSRAAEFFFESLAPFEMAFRGYGEANNGLQRLNRLLMAQNVDLNAARAASEAAARDIEHANRAKSHFLSRMSHELRTPLNAILGFAQLLDMDDLKLEQHESVHQVLRGGAHLLDIINEVLDIARIETGRLSLSPEPIAIGEILRDVIELVRPLAARRKIVLESDAVSIERSGYVLADRQRVTEILLNLLSNAVKYNREGGVVRLTCAEVPQERVRISVSDTGAGIHPEKLQRLFHPFERLGAERTTIEGTGLGLLLSKGLAEAMGGSLGVESQVDIGSTFWVELAQSDALAETSADTVRGPAASWGADSGVTGTVLYIEDNISNRQLMERVLARRAGVRLIAAADAQTGLGVAQTTPPDLILLDLHLPDMEGKDVLQRLWEDRRTRAIPVAVLSADATPSQIGRLLASGAIAYLTKPLDVAQVLTLVDETLTGDQKG